MSTLNIADKPTLDTVDSDVTYIKNNLPSGSSSPILVIKNDNMDFTGVEFTVSCGDFTDTVTMPDDDSVEVEVPYIGEYIVSYSDDLSINDQININGVGKTLYIPTAVTIPSFANATWEQIGNIITAYYNDEIDDLSNYWSVGDTKTISLSAMQAPNPNSSQTWLAQDIVITILDFNHTDLATPINGHTKTAVTLQTREVLNNNTSESDQAGHIYINGNSSYDTTFTKWSNLYMRTYLNDKVYNAFPSEVKSLIKPSKHYRHTTYNGTESEEVTDNLFLPSYPEIYGTASNGNYVVTNPVEGTQFKYYATSANRVKYGNNDGTSNGTRQSWWQGSPISSYTDGYGYLWCCVGDYGTSFYAYGNSALGLAPAFAI